MTRRLSTLALAATLCLAPSSAAVLVQPADTAPDKAADDAREQALEIISRHIEAVGGEHAVRLHTSITSTGTLSVPSVGIEGSMITRLKAPNLSIVTIDLPGLGQSSTGYDGAVGWYIDPTLGAGIMEGEQLEAYLRGADIYADLRTEGHYQTIRYDGMDQLDGKPVNTVTLVDKHGRESTQYFSAQSGLRVAAHAVEVSPLGEIPVRTTFSDYKEFGGVKFATRSTQHIGPQAILITVEDVVFDTIPGDAFELPEAIRIVIEQREAAEAESGGDDAGGDSGDAEGGAWEDG